MCDYSLMALKNRLAVDGEELLVHRFIAGPIGLVSATEVHNVPQLRHRLWEKVKQFFHGGNDRAFCVVCIPPGARLMLRDIPAKLQKEIGLDRDVEQVIFTQLGTVGFRDAIRFRNGREVLLQRLTDGQRVRILSLECSVSEPASVEQHPQTMLF